MINYYSASTQGFYTSEINGNNLPEDCVEITEEYKSYLLSSESPSKRIMPDESGFPILTDVFYSREDKALIERAWRDAELFSADIEINKIQDSDQKALATELQWRGYRKNLRDWPENKNFPDSSKRPLRPPLKE